MTTTARISIPSTVLDSRAFSPPPRLSRISTENARQIDVPNEKIKSPTSPSSPTSPLFSTGVMTITLKTVSLNNPVQNLSFKMKVGGTTIVTAKRKEKQERYDFTVHEDYKIPMTYHSYLFDALKIYIHTSTSIINRKIGRAKTKISEMPVNMLVSEGKFHGDFVLPIKSDSSKVASVGTISITVHCKWDTIFRPRSSSLIRRPKTLSRNDSGNGESISNFSFDSLIIDDSFAHSLKLPPTPSSQVTFRQSKRVSTPSIFSVSPRVRLRKNRSSVVPKKMYGLRKTELKFTRFDGVKEVTHLLKVFLGDGMQVDGVVDFIGSWILFGKYQRLRGIGHPSLTKGARLLPEYKKIAYLHDVYQYALAAYGWGGLTAFRYINGVTTLSNSKAVSKHLQLKDDDILLFEMSEYGFGNGRNSEYDKNPSINSVHQDWQTGGICKPGFFVVKADKLDAIVVCVRGTFNLSDVLTDLICHYVPFRGGSAHQGILFSANRIYSFLLPKLKSFVATYRPKKLIITGHSLGAGVSSILTILLADHESEFRRLSGHGEKFKVMGFCYAPPPTVSKDLCEAYRNHIVGVVLKNDIVPRLSYGNFNDLKLFLGKAGELKGGNLIMPKIPELSYPHLDRLREQAKRSSVDRLYIPGRIYHLVHSNSESTYYKPGSYRSKATKSPYAIGSRINLHSREIQKSSKKRPHMELWKIDAFGMDEILTGPNCFKNHLPQLYDYGLLKAKIWAFEKGRF